MEFLQAAIEEANALSNPSSISFDIPGPGDVPVIYPNSPLPRIEMRVFINGASQPGGWVELAGNVAGAGADGLVFAGDRSKLKGMIIGGFDGHGFFHCNSSFTISSSSLSFPCSSAEATIEGDS